VTRLAVEVRNFHARMAPLATRIFTIIQLQNRSRANRLAAPSIRRSKTDEIVPHTQNGTYNGLAPIPLLVERVSGHWA
jgi:hypothetical protein